MMSILALLAQAPATGDDFPLIPLLLVVAAAVIIAIVLSVLAKKKK